MPRAATGLPRPIPSPAMGVPGTTVFEEPPKLDPIHEKVSGTVIWIVESRLVDKTGISVALAVVAAAKAATTAIERIDFFILIFLKKLILNFASQSGLHTKGATPRNFGRKKIAIF